LWSALALALLADRLELGGYPGLPVLEAGLLRLALERVDAVDEGSLPVLRGALTLLAQMLDVGGNLGLPVLRLRTGLLLRMALAQMLKVAGHGLLPGNWSGRVGRRNLLHKWLLPVGGSSAHLLHEASQRVLPVEAWSLRSWDLAGRALGRLALSCSFLSRGLGWGSQLYASFCQELFETLIVSLAVAFKETSVEILLESQRGLGGGLWSSSSAGF
jgi:hypothetical protein